MRPNRLLLWIPALAALGLVWWSLQGRAVDPAQPHLGAEDEPPASTERSEGDLLGARGVADESDPAAPPRNGYGISARATKGAKVHGFVRDETGRGIRDARVVLHVVDPQSLRGAPYPDLETLGETTTDRDGAFELPALGNAWLRVVASASGRATVGQRIASAGAEVVLVLPPAGTLRVQVLDHAGSPAAEVEVRVSAGDTAATGLTAADGTVDFAALAPGSAQVRAIGRDHTHAVGGPFVISAGAATEAVLLLGRAVRLEGIVRDDRTNAPVEGAEVHVSHPGWSDAAGPTGVDGRFGPVPGGAEGERVFLAVRAEGHVPLLEPVVLRAEGVQSVELRLVPGEPWRGIVQHADGRPAPGATVGYTADGVAGRAPASTVSDEEGRFVLAPPPPPAPGRRVVLVARLGDAVGALALRPDTLRPEVVVLALAEGAVVRGTVARADGSPLAGVGVRMAPDWQAVDRGPDADAASARLLATNEEGFVGLAGASGADGRWEIRGAPLGVYRVSFEHEGATYPRAETLAVRESSVDAGRERLGAGLLLEGTVRDASGAPLAGCAVRVAPVDAAAQTRRASTAADGSFAFRGLAPGRHRVTATWADLDPLRGEVDLEEGKDALIELDFEAGGILEATLRAGDAPYTGIVALTLRGDGSTMRTRNTRAAQGVLRLGDLPTGQFELEAATPDGRRARLAGLELRAGQTTTVTLDLVRGARLQGVVRTPEGAPVATARVTLIQAESAGRMRLLATTDARGGYVFAELLPGPWSLVVQGRGGGPSGVDVTLAPGETRELDVKLGAAGTLDVEVVDERGRPVARAVLLWRDDSGQNRSLLPVRTDAQGRAQLTDVSAEVDLTVRARALDGRTASGRVRVLTDTATKLVLRLPAP